MAYTITIVAITIAAIITYNWYLKNVRIDALKAKRSQKPKVKAIKPSQTTSQYRCVVMVNTELGCQAAKKLQSKLMLMNEAPVLPLSKCDKKKCNCRYKRYEDRRMHDRRSTLSGASSIIARAQRNKRHQSDRRKPGGGYVTRLDQETITLT